MFVTSPRSTTGKVTAHEPLNDTDSCAKDWCSIQPYSKALRPVTACPKMRLCTSCVPSYVYTLSRFSMCRMAAYSAKIPFAPSSRRSSCPSRRCCWRSCPAGPSRSGRSSWCCWRRRSRRTPERSPRWRSSPRPTSRRCRGRPGSRAARRGCARSWCTTSRRASCCRRRTERAPARACHRHHPRAAWWCCRCRCCRCCPSTRSRRR